MERENMNPWDRLKELLGSDTAAVGDIKAYIESLSAGALWSNAGGQARGDGKIDAVMHFFYGGDYNRTYCERRWSLQNNSGPASWSSAIGRYLFQNGNIKIDPINAAYRQSHLTLDDSTPVKKALAEIKRCISAPGSPYHPQTGFLGALNSYIGSGSSSAGGAGKNAGAERSVTLIVADAIESSEKKQVVFTGAPGTGKTYSVEKYVKDTTGQSGEDGASHPSWEFVQFHSSYDYTDFVEGLRPIQKNGKMSFVLMDGIFKSFCRKILKDGKPDDCYFIIDEINRADLGRVFGELMYCFEKRGPKHKVKTQYHNLHTYDPEKEDFLESGEDVFADGFFIPENLVILGTMNDIDRSVETFDFALRRRFDWVEIDADEIMRSSLESMAEKGMLTGGVTDGLVARIREMNRIIAQEPGLGSAFAIGHAYFKGYDGENLEEIWRRNLRPILREYMRGRSGLEEFVRRCHQALASDPPVRTDAPAEGSDG